ncbi:hypothetical protein JDV02_002631 [Purpureocillium takamizusanense]|uniref:Uncharacterized protein n=1 Tax=Purpureocillium takamizusanense TaxID=2060973 RepID=A0A9Q8QBE5_9HYPO|nr:uncharacterized protein JDV02_002631 [Purpureocillium takamizusanense]UNI16167.1 hypothetical protein JDV02_002631 [Purpureocillium takamizusanense]
MKLISSLVLFLLCGGVSASHEGWCKSKESTCVLTNPGKTEAEKKEFDKYKCHRNYPCEEEGHPCSFDKSSKGYVCQ